MSAPSARLSLDVLLDAALRGHREALERALLVHVPSEWHDGDPEYRDADQPQAIVKAMMLPLHRHLRKSRIGCVYRQQLAGKVGKMVLAHASKVGSKLKHWAELDFLIELNWLAWTNMEPQQKLALIDHELCHFGMETKENGDEKCLILPHDVEEFTPIVARWGLWKEDVRAFAKVARQFELFDATPAPEGPTLTLESTAPPSLEP